jgi:transposase
MLAARPKSTQAMAMRARIVLGCGAGESNGAVAKRLKITGATVCKWRERFRTKRLEGLLDEPRPGAPRSITDKQVEAVVTATLESMPKHATHWSTRRMAEKSGLSQSAVVRIWKTFGLQPHRVENFKLSKDPQFVEKVRDVVGLYMNPPERAMVLCVDEKSQVTSVEPHPADSTHETGRSSSSISRLRTPWRYFSVCCTGREIGKDNQCCPSAAPPPGVSQVSGSD